MARRKETITQVDFSFGSPRPESIEREDTPLVLEGVKDAENTISLSTGALEVRPGLLHKGRTFADNGFEVDLGAGRVFDLHILESGVVLYGPDHDEVVRFKQDFWSQMPERYGSLTFGQNLFWVVPDPDTSTILIGATSYPTKALSVDGDGVWTFGLFQYYTDLMGAIRQPYWPYHAGVIITPSAEEGSITVTASEPIFTANYVGMRIRISGRELLLTGFTSATEMDADVFERLPPTYLIGVADPGAFDLGQSVEHELLGGQGLVTATATGLVKVRATALWDGFSIDGKLIGPNSAQEISSIQTTAPSGTLDWDMQMGNKVFGYPGWGAKHKGRVYLCGYPSAPNAFAVSSAQRIDDFTFGTNDGDAFIETLGANDGGDLLYIIPSEDLLFFTSRGLYYQFTRGGEDVTPRTIAPVRFTSMGSSLVRPIAVDDGVVFVDAVGEQVYAAVLGGDANRFWKIEPIAQFHNHLISAPRFLGATTAGSERPENFVFVINSDGTAAVCQWDRTQGKIGWRRWTTAGAFRSIYQVFGGISAVVDRFSNAPGGGFLGRFREVFERGIYVDACSLAEVGNPVSFLPTSIPTHLNGANAAVYLDGWDLGDYDVDAQGNLTDAQGSPIAYPEYDGIAQIGLPFTVRVTPWPRRSSLSQRSVREVKRLVEVYITVQDTLVFSYENARFGGHLSSDDLSVPPVLRSEEFRTIVGGRGAFIDRPIEVTRPGPFRLLKLRYRVAV